LARAIRQARQDKGCERLTPMCYIGPITAKLLRLSVIGIELICLWSRVAGTVLSRFEVIGKHADKKADCKRVAIMF
jgi:hypothetical protein